MPGWKRFVIGASGALLPMLVTLLAVDLAGLIDHRAEYSLGTYVGTGVKYVILFLLGGIVAAFNADETKTIRLVQIGIAAPALIASYVNTQNPSPKFPTAEAKPAAALADKGPSFNFVSAAYALDRQRVPHPVYLIRIGGFLDDVFRGATGNLQNLATEAVRRQAAAVEAQRRAAATASAASAKKAANAAAKAAKDAAAADNRPAAESAAVAAKSAADAAASANHASGNIVGQDERDAHEAAQAAENALRTTPMRDNSQPSHGRNDLVASPEVRRAQQYLFALGFELPAVNGVMDYKTSEAVRSFKRGHGLPDDDQIDQSVIASMKQELINQPDLR